MTPGQLKAHGWQLYLNKQNVKETHTFYIKLAVGFPSVFVTLHLQDGTCTLRDFKEEREEVTQPTQLNSLQAASELLRT